jgi:glutamyl-tRNA synthetase
VSGPRVRIAPSPTGYFHVGTARTALFNWLFARQQGGTFVLRIEDTDTARNRPEHTEGILRAMRWLALDWDEGPYFQSERFDRYGEAVERLLATGHAYACDCRPEIVGARHAAAGRRPDYGYDGFCRDRGLAPGPGVAVRFRTPDDGATAFDDVVRGKVTTEHAHIEDFALQKSNGAPLFLLANVVDDAEMRISHVIRGEDHVPNTPKYLLLWDALGFGTHPVFAHLPLLHNEAHKKLSKRRDRVAVEDYRDAGFLPEAMVNYLGLLGWSPSGDREIVSRDEMVAEFRLEDVKSAPAIFDERKLQSVNAEYLRALPATVFVERATGWLTQQWAPLAAQVQERARTLSEAVAMIDFLILPEPLFDPGEWAKETARQPQLFALLQAVAERYGSLEEWSAAGIRDATVAAGEHVGATQLRKVQAPIRLAVTGRSVGPPLWESLEVLGRDRTIARLHAAGERLTASPTGQGGAGPTG